MFIRKIIFFTKLTYTRNPILCIKFVDIVIQVDNFVDNSSINVHLKIVYKFQNIVFFFKQLVFNVVLYVKSILRKTKFVWCLNLK